MVNIDRIKQVREERQCSLQYAKRIVEIEELHAEIDAANSVDDIKQILKKITQ